VFPDSVFLCVAACITQVGDSACNELWNYREVSDCVTGHSSCKDQKVSGVTCRWDASKPAGVDNLVLMTFEQADQHDEGGAAAHQRTTDAYSNYVEQRLELVRTEYGFT